MSISASERGQYAYFSSLERTIKIALSIYILALAVGAAGVV